MGSTSIKPICSRHNLCPHPVRKGILKSSILIGGFPWGISIICLAPGPPPAGATRQTTGWSRDYHGTSLHAEA